MGNPQEHPMMDDGIFLGYDKNIPLKNEGLGRLLAFLVSGWVRLPDRRLTIACPYWLVEDLKALLADHGVSSDRYELLRTPEPWYRQVQLRLKTAERAMRPGVHRIRSWIRGESLPEAKDFLRLFDAKPWYWGFLTGAQARGYCRDCRVDFDPLLVGVRLFRRCFCDLSSMAGINQETSNPEPAVKP